MGRRKEMTEHESKNMTQGRLRERRKDGRDTESILDRRKERQWEKTNRRLNE